MPNKGTLYMTFPSVTPRLVITIWLALLVLAVVGCVVGFSGSNATDRNTLIIGLITALSSVAAVPLFFIGLRHFEKNARRAFTLVCAGMVMYGVGSIQFPIVNLLDAGAVWVSSGVAVVPFVLTVGLQYFGIRRFGRLMLIKSWAFAWPLVIASACVVAGAVVLLPGTNPLLVIQAWLFTIVVCTVLAANAIRARIAARYRRAITWLVIGDAMAAFAVVTQAIVIILQLPPDHWYLASGFSAWASALTALLMVYIGYEFTRIEANLTAHSSQKKANAAEVVLYAASLASDPWAVDKSLDRLRIITSRKGYNPETPLDATQEAALAETYKEIEHYLMQDDPVLHFDPAVLRESIRARFDVQSNANSPFWQLFHS